MTDQLPATVQANHDLADQRTPEGALALRLIASSAAWIDGVDLAAAITPTIRAALPAAVQEAHAALTPALRRDFKRLVSPTLALVAPAGMSEEDITAWLATAAETLRGIPADLLEVGCRAARQTADHPSKIMPAIMKTVLSMWDQRKRDLARLNRIERAERGETVRNPWDNPWDAEPFDPTRRCTPAQAKDILVVIGLDLAATE